jgi:hypothetical protein
VSWDTGAREGLRRSAGKMNLFGELAKLMGGGWVDSLLQEGSPPLRPRHGNFASGSLELGKDGIPE